jgi:hypothetical protein
MASAGYGTQRLDHRDNSKVVPGTPVPPSEPCLTSSTVLGLTGLNRPQHTVELSVTESEPRSMVCAIAQTLELPGLPNDSLWQSCIGSYALRFSQQGERVQVGLTGQQGGRARLSGCSGAAGRKWLLAATKKYGCAVS